MRVSRSGGDGGGSDDDDDDGHDAPDPLFDDSNSARVDKVNESDEISDMVGLLLGMSSKPHDGDSSSTPAPQQGRAMWFVLFFFDFCGFVNRKPPLLTGLTTGIV